MESLAEDPTPWMKPMPGRKSRIFFLDPVTQGIKQMDDKVDQGMEQKMDDHTNPNMKSYLTKIDETAKKQVTKEEPSHSSDVLYLNSLNPSDHDSTMCRSNCVHMCDLCDHICGNHVTSGCYKDCLCDERRFKGSGLTIYQHVDGVDELSQTNSDLHDLLAEKDEQVVDLGIQVSQLVENKRKLQETIAKLQSEKAIDDMKRASSLGVLLGELQEENNKLKKLQAEREESLQREAAIIQQHILTAKDRANDLNTKLRELRALVDQEAQTVSDQQTELVELKDQYKRLEVENAQLREEIAWVEEDLAKAQETGNLWGYVKTFFYTIGYYFMLAVLFFALCFIARLAIEYLIEPAIVKPEPRIQQTKPY